MIFKDPLQPIDNRVSDLLSHMTAEEKVGQLCMLEVKHGLEFMRRWHIGTIIHQFGEPTLQWQRDLGDTHRLQIPILVSLDCIHGHTFYPGATMFPTQLGMSCSWNADMAEKAGHITAREMRATGVHWTFSPLLDMARDIRWGRVNETFGEDPYLTGILGAAIVKGYQGKDLSDPDSVLACAKHFAGYCDTIGGRDSSECQLSERQLRHDIFPPYQMVFDAQCATAMAGYHALDGVPCSASKWLLTDVLRGEMKFEGFVVSDWENVNHFIVQQQLTESREEAAAILVSSGNDMSMATPWFCEAACGAIASGRLPMAIVDEACRRILRVKFKLGIFDKKRYPDFTRIPEVVGCKEHMDAALVSSVESLVLLENKNETLPIAKKIKKIAIVGPNADDIIAQLGDWAVAPGGADEHFAMHAKLLRDKKVTVLDELRKRAQKNDITLEFCKGCDVMDTPYNEIEQAGILAAKADLVIAVVGDNRDNTGEWKDRADMNLSGKQQLLLETVKKSGKPLVVVLLAGKPHTIPWVQKNADALLVAFNPGICGGEAIAGTLFGDHNPSGKLTVSFPWHIGQQPVRYNQPTGWHSKGDYYDMPDGQGLRMYPFGFGKSYTTFGYSDVSVASSTIKAGENVVASVKVTNTGKIAGTEIVELYIKDVAASVAKPPKLLKGFSRTALKPGETKQVNFTVPYHELAIMTADKKWVVEPGKFEVLVGGSSRDEDLIKAEFVVV